MSRETLIPPVPLTPNDAPNDFVCALCHELPLIPVLTPCEHCFCRSCIEEAAVRHRSECPIDRNAFEKDDIKPISGMLRRVYDQIAVKCPHDGCSWEGKIGSYANHAGRCNFRFGVDGINLEAETEIAELQKENATLRKERDEATQKVQRLQHSLNEERRTTRGRLERTIEQLRTERDGATQKTQRLQQQVQQLRAVSFDHTYSYGREGVVALTQLICKYLENKPEEIDRNRIFNCVRACYQDLVKGWGDNPEHYYIDVRMLINVCCSSVWFSDNQMNNIRRWANEQGWG